MKKKYTKKSKKEQESESNEQLQLYEEVEENKELVEHIKHIDKDFVKYHNRHRYFYLHQDEEEFNAVDKLKKDEF